VNKHVKCGGWLMVNHCIVPTSGVITVAIGGSRPSTVTIYLVGGTNSTLDCESPEKARELLDAIWLALAAPAPVQAVGS
jgi:hypothetical protein